MFGTLLAKEILETVLDLRFVVATLLCVVLIPLGMYVSREDYEQRLAAYQREHDTYRQRHGTPEPPVTGREEAQGFRPPSVLSIFASGLDPFLPDKVATSYTGLFRTLKEAGTGNPQSLLFGKADLLFNVTFLVSLIALVFTFNCVSGERERGTLRLAIANSVPRSRILLSKIAGKYIALLIPFTLSILIALLVLGGSSVVPIGSPQVWLTVLVILAATLLFLLGMVSLGICISTFTRHSMGSIVLLFLVWAMFLFGVPKISPMLAEILHPAESGSVIDLAKRMAREEIEREFQRTERETIDVRWKA
ncbi:MAG: ABC transporter permease subunit, partial [Sedimentisphaerales bacterium]|nr:ABC transporter permease subunit [Sedimentisphaerales bacterium]